MILLVKGGELGRERVKIGPSSAYCLNTRPPSSLEQKIQPPFNVSLIYKIKASLLFSIKFSVIICYNIESIQPLGRESSKV